MTGAAGTVQVFERNRETGSRQLVQSGPSLQPVYLRLINRTNKSADLVWINYQGEGVRYATLQPYHWFDVSTFEGHPWVFRDTQTGDKLIALDLSPRRRAIPVEVYHPLSPPARQLVRKVVPIVLPVLSLKELAISAVSKQLSGNNRSCMNSERAKEIVCELPVPRNLQRDLVIRMDQRYRYRQAFVHPNLQYDTMDDGP